MTDQASKTAVLLLMLRNYRGTSNRLRRYFKLDKADDHSMVSKLEIAMSKNDKLFNLNVIPDSEWEEGETIQAYYKHSDKSHEIGIKETVYEKACEGKLSALFTFVHETAHWGLINGFLLCKGIKKWKSLDEKCRRNFRKMHENFADAVTFMLLYRDTGKSYEERRKA